MQRKLRQYLKNNDFFYTTYRMLTSKEYREYCADLGRNGRIFRFQHLGEQNPERNIYFIREGGSFQGMFSLIIWTMRRLEVAEKFHFVPVVAWSEDVAYNVENHTNPFLLYFQPVSDISVASALKSVDVAFSHGWDRAYGSPAETYEFSEDEIERFVPLYQKYMKLQPDIQEKIEREIDELLGQAHGKVLGVHVRGVDLRKIKVYTAAIPASEEEYLRTAKDMLRDLGYEKLFLASDSEETIQLFQTEFGDRLITTQALRASVGSSILAIYNDENDGYQMGYEVLRDAYALAACDSLLCGLSYVSYGARIIHLATGAKPYEKTVILNKGKFENGVSCWTAEKKERKQLRKG